MKKTILLIGGGTGGHVSPVFSLYEKLSKLHPDYEIVVIGTGSDIERRTYSGVKKYEVIKTGKLNRRITLKNFKEMFLLGSGLVQSRMLLKKYRPKLIFSKGGFASVPILKLAQRYKVPYFIHESDIEMGLANRITGRSAEKIFIGFPKEYYKDVSKEKLIYSGQILSDKTRIADKFGDISSPSIYITGGSLGAKVLNAAVSEAIKELTARYKIYHQTGLLNLEEMKSITDELPNEFKERYTFTGFWENKEALELIQKCDLIVTRAGATTLAEVACYRKPAILIPYKYAASDHQAKNIQYLASKGEISYIYDDELNGETLLASIIKVMEDKKMQEKLAENLAQNIKFDGLDIVIKEIERVME